MTTSDQSRREILRASSIIGGASVINVLVGLARVKVAALVLGPIGVGLIGLLQALLQAASTIGSLSLGTAGARQIASIPHGHDDELVSERRALRKLVSGLAVFAGLAFFLFRYPIATFIVGDPSAASSVGWLSIGVTLTIAAAYQSALLTGLRRIEDIARISVYSSLLAAAFGVTAIFLWGKSGIVPFLLAMPAATFLFGLRFVRRLTPPASSPQSNSTTPQIRIHFGPLVRTGAALTVSTFLTMASQLGVRVIVERRLGLDALGHFQAAWLISITYLGFVLQAMSSEYFPRLTAVISERHRALRTVNDQTETVLLLSAPILLLMLGLAPWIITILYSSAFAEAANILRWQILGDVLKVASWPLGFILLARGDGKSYMAAEVSAAAVLLGSTAVLVPMLGVEATGIAVLLMYGWYLPCVWLLIRKHLEYCWTRGIAATFTALATSCIVVFVIGRFSDLAGVAAGLALAAAFALFALNRLRRSPRVQVS